MMDSNELTVVNGDVDVHIEAVEPVNQSPESVDDTASNKRDTWSSKLDFILSAVGFAVGLGNVWRFPYLCFSNGGGAFLIPYFIFMIFLGLPLFYMELALGQFASVGSISVWRLCPLFKGLGYTMVGVSILVSVYYNVLLAYTIYYLFASFTSHLPWSDAGSGGCGQANATGWWNETFNSSFINNSDVTGDDAVACLNGTNSSSSRSAAEQYWKYKVLGISDDTNIGNIGDVQWHLALCLLLGWILVYVCIMKGIKSSGKVVYFTATFPYLILFILLIRGVTLPGASTGIKYYLQIDTKTEDTFGRLAHGQVWKDAAIQILFSLGPGFGTLIMLGSYNKFNNKCNWDAVIVTVINCATSLFAGFVVFSILGFMAEKQQVPVDRVADDGPGLAFVAYPAVVAKMPAAPFWSICFFFMLIMLALDSQFVCVECIVTAVVDEFDIIRRWKKISTLVVCCVLFLAGLPCTTEGGIYIVELIDKFTLAFPLLIVVLLELIIISYIYGLLWFSDDIEQMLGVRPNVYWQFCWSIAAPLLILFVILFSCIEGVHLVYDGYQFPAWAEGIGWLVAAAVIAMIPAWAIVTVYQTIGSCQALCWLLRSPASVAALNLHDVIRPADNWGPVLESNRHKPHQSVHSFHWVYTLPRLFHRTTPPVDSPGAVVYHEGDCFVTDTSFYHQSTEDSHNRY